LEKFILIGPYKWDEIPGQVSVTVTAITPNDWKSTSPEGLPVAPPQTIRELKQQFGGTKGHLTDAISGQKFLFDLAPWNHLNEETYLQMSWSFRPDHPIPPHITPPWRKGRIGVPEKV
jgi:hypothetical protein